MDPSQNDKRNIIKINTQHCHSISTTWKRDETDLSEKSNCLQKKSLLCEEKEKKKRCWVLKNAIVQKTRKHFGIIICWTLHSNIYLNNPNDGQKKNGKWNHCDIKTKKPQ